jgi:ABC-type thiamine transport system substrate-binding protein
VTACYKALFSLALGAALLLASCGGSDKQSKQVVLVTHDAFAISPAVKKAFEAESSFSRSSGGRRRGRHASVADGR